MNTNSKAVVLGIARTPFGKLGGALAPLSATTPDMYDNIMSLIQHINISVNDGKQPRSVVDSGGVAMLEYCQQVGLNLDQATLQLSAVSQPQIANMGSTANNTKINPPQALPLGVYQMSYRVPMVHPWISEPLRSRCYLPVHTYPQDPVLTLTFQNAATMYTGGVIGSIFVEIELVRRVPTAASEASLQKTAGSNPNGYIDWDLIETPFTIAPGVGSEQRFPLPIPGAYNDLVFRQYLGGANVSRSPIDGSGIGGSTATGFGNESRWRIETGLVVMREWRWKHLRAINDFSRPGWPVAANLILSAGTVNSYSYANGNIGCGSFANGGGAGNATNFRDPSSTCLNFLNDGLSSDDCVELGSLLDCNTPANNGLKMEIIGTPANVATNGSTLSVMGRRFFGDLSRWQKFS